jgi:hypothetical protein
MGGHNRENKNQRELLWSCLPHSVSPLAIGRNNEGESSVNPLSCTSESSLRHNLIMPWSFKCNTWFKFRPWLYCVLESDVHSFTTGEKWTRLHILYRLIHDLWTLLQEMISRSLWSKKLISTWVLFWMVMELWVLIVVNTLLWTAPRKSHYTVLNLLEQQESAEAAICNWQLALFTT